MTSILLEEPSLIDLNGRGHISYSHIGNTRRPKKTESWYLQSHLLPAVCMRDTNKHQNYMEFPFCEADQIILPATTLCGNLHLLLRTNLR